MTLFLKNLLSTYYLTDTLGFSVIFNYFTFGCAGFWLLCRLFSSCGEQELLCSWSVWASHCGSFSCCKTQAWWVGFSSCDTCGLSSQGSWALEHRLSSCGAQASVVPSPAGSSWTKHWMHVCLLPWQVDSLPLSHQWCLRLFLVSIFCEN